MCFIPLLWQYSLQLSELSEIGRDQSPPTPSPWVGPGRQKGTMVVLYPCAVLQETSRWESGTKARLKAED